MMGEGTSRKERRAATEAKRLKIAGMFKSKIAFLVAEEGQTPDQITGDLIRYGESLVRSCPQDKTLIKQSFRKFVDTSKLLRTIITKKNSKEAGK